MTDYKCPSCGAVLKVNENDNIVKCEYCDTVIDLERKSSDISSHNAKALAQQIREYKQKKDKVEDARNCFREKEEKYSQIQKEGEKISTNAYLTAGVIWLIGCFLVNSILSSALYYHDVIRVFLDVVICVAGAYYAWKIARAQNDKKLNAHKEKEDQAKIQREYALKTYSELAETFDEEFLPYEVRNDEAISYIIKALETERAYTLKQAIGQWEDRADLQEQLRNANTMLNNIPDSVNDGKTNAGAETLGAFTGAALGAFGGAVAREAIKEIKRHL